MVTNYYEYMFFTKLHLSSSKSNQILTRIVHISKWITCPSRERWLPQIGLSLPSEHQWRPCTSWHLYQRPCPQWSESLLRRSRCMRRTVLRPLWYHPSPEPSCSSPHHPRLGRLAGWWESWNKTWFLIRGYRETKETIDTEEGNILHADFILDRWISLEKSVTIFK